MGQRDLTCVLGVRQLSLKGGTLGEGRGEKTGGVSEGSRVKKVKKVYYGRVEVSLVDLWCEWKSGLHAHRVSRKVPFGSPSRCH